MAFISRPLSLKEFECWCEGAEILEKDGRGLKVLKLYNGDILKIFRVKRLFSSARLYSYARRFYRNALCLHRLGVLTVQVKQLFHFVNSSNTAVLYEPLPGLTLRQLLASDHLTPEIAVEVGKFIAQLHQLGIYFRSLHLGNIVLTPNGVLGVIDIADMSVRNRSLRWTERLRNFRHLYRYPNDIRKIGKEVWGMLLQSYFSQSGLPNNQASKLKYRLQLLSIFDRSTPSV